MSKFPDQSKEILKFYMTSINKDTLKKWAQFGGEKNKTNHLSRTQPPGILSM